MQKLSLGLIAAGLIGLAATPGLAAPSSQSKAFASNAAQSGLAEVQEGQLAQQKASSPQVRRFGQTLEQDHSAANQRLQEIAQQEKITLPAQPSHKQRSELKKLRRLSGQQFDRAFAQEEVKDHQKAIAQFEREARSGKDATMKTFARDTLPVLRKHLQIAQSLASNR
ncbi:MAG TPA: DUF4142 domain-containing protein [Acetobacteraceae bacterium]|nr:DUF4142 domain-containing protein [Acetobacteraceae bacterium]